MTWAEKGLPFRLPHHTRARLIYDMAMVTCNRTTVPERFSAIAAPMIATAEEKQVGFFCLFDFYTRLGEWSIKAAPKSDLEGILLWVAGRKQWQGGNAGEQSLESLLKRDRIKVQQDRAASCMNSTP